MCCSLYGVHALCPAYFLIHYEGHALCFTVSTEYLGHPNSEEGLINVPLTRSATMNTATNMRMLGVPRYHALRL